MSKNKGTKKTSNTEMKKLYWDLEETQVQDDSNESSNLESLMKEYLDCLTKINQLLRPEDGPVVQCRIHELTELLKGELMKQLFQLSGRIDMEEIQPVDLFRAFQTFCIEKKGLRGTLFDFVFNILNREILVEYLTIQKRSHEMSAEQLESERQKIDGFIHRLYMDLVQLWQEFRKSEMTQLN